MKPETTQLADLKNAAQQWKAKIDDLQSQAEQQEGGARQKNLELMQELQKQQALIEAYLAQVEREEHAAWDQKAAQLIEMFDDLDKNYREALPYFL